MMGSAPGVEVLNACRLLFPAAFSIDAGFLCTIAEKDLKSAFRKKALKTHPDRSIVLGCNRDELSRQFQEVSSAYKTLQLFVTQQSRNKPHVREDKASRPSSSGSRCRQTAMKDHFYQGVLPWRVLRLGEYLYYSGVISWRTLIGAIVWQKRQRPLFGEIARQWRLLSDEDIRFILRTKTRQEMFGECARRHGFLSRFQQLAVTGRQRELQPLFGRHFIENNLMSAFQIETLARRQAQHNRRLRYQ